MFVCKLHIHYVLMDVSSFVSESIPSWRTNLLFVARFKIPPVLVVVEIVENVHRAMVLRKRNAFVYARCIVDGTTCYFPSDGVLRWDLRCGICQQDQNQNGRFRFVWLRLAHSVCVCVCVCVCVIMMLCWSGCWDPDVKKQLRALFA